MIEKHSLTFDVLSDPGSAYAAQLGVAFDLPDDLAAVYGKLGINLPKHNGEDRWQLPMPGRFVIDREGIVRVVDVDPDYTNRPEPQKTLDDLAALG